LKARKSPAQYFQLAILSAVCAFVLRFCVGLLPFQGTFLSTLATGWLVYLTFLRAFAFGVRIRDSGRKVSKEICGSHSSPLWSPFSVLQFTVVVFSALKTSDDIYLFLLLVIGDCHG